jgi:hypothetical protein
MVKKMLTLSQVPLNLRFPIFFAFGTTPSLATSSSSRRRLTIQLGGNRQREALWNWSSRVLASYLCEAIHISFDRLVVSKAFKFLNENMVLNPVLRAEVEIGQGGVPMNTLKTTPEEVQKVIPALWKRQMSQTDEMSIYLSHFSVSLRFMVRAPIRYETSKNLSLNLGNYYMVSGRSRWQVTSET